MDLIQELNVSAASGLVKHLHSFYVISDDENSLIEISKQQTLSYPLFSGALPDEAKIRKKLKPDLESLSILSDLVFAIPSGSTENRMKGATFSISTKQITHFSLAQLYVSLAKEFAELNIEGSAFINEEFWLFQRGNGKHSQNGIIILDRDIFRSEWKLGQITPHALKSIHHTDLGNHLNAPLGFTDACFINEKIYFLCVSEDTTSTYDDGKFLGAFIGRMNLSRQIEKLIPIDCQHKPEGLWIDQEKIYIVTDADNRKISSKLLSCNLQVIN